jgi:5-methylcytosine-specific restriction protein A
MKFDKPKRRVWEGKKDPPREWVSPDKKFYNSAAWRKNREGFLMKEPMCKICEDEHRLTPAKAVDHIKPIREGGHKWSWSNLQGLCLSCHAKKTREENRKRK